MRRLLLRCYPARWRARYGAEFGELLAARPLGPFDVADVLLAALDAHLHLRGLGAASEHARGFAMSLRIGGIGAIVGGLSWVVAMAGSGLTDDFTVFPLWGVLLLSGTAGLLIALIGLSAFQARAHPLLVWSAFALPALGAAISLTGMVGMAVLGDVIVAAGLSPWAVWSIGTIGLVMGSALFAVATWRTRVLSRRATGVLLAGSLAVVPMLGIGSGLVPAPVPAEAVLLAMVMLFGTGWAWLGASALRLDRRQLAARPGAAAS